MRPTVVPAAGPRPMSSTPAGPLPPPGLDTISETPRQLQQLWFDHPRLALALRAAVAASLAWFAAGFLPDPAGDFPYYAPLGAVVATTFSLAGSVRESARAVASIAAGGAVGWLVGIFSDFSTPLTVGVAVALGVVIAGAPGLGTMGAWVPSAALFTLIIGNGEVFYIGIYAGLTLMGAAIGVCVNAMAPPLPLAPARTAVAALRRATATELDHIADRFESPEAPAADDTDRHSQEVLQARTAMHTAIDLAVEAQRGNLPGRRHRDAITALQRDSVQLDRITTVAADLNDLLLREQHLPADGSTVIGLREELWPPVVRALRNMACALRGAERTAAHEEDSDAVATAMRQLGELPGELPERAEQDNIVTASVLLALHRGLEALG